MGNKVRAFAKACLNYLPAKFKATLLWNFCSYKCVSNVLVALLLCSTPSVLALLCSSFLPCPCEALEWGLGTLDGWWRDCSHLLHAEKTWQDGLHPGARCVGSQRGEDTAKWSLLSVVRQENKKTRAHLSEYWMQTLLSLVIASREGRT